MKGLIQRVSYASVTIGGGKVAAIENGLLVFLGIEKQDCVEKADKLLRKVMNYRVFPDDQDKMNLSVLDIQGGLLVVSQFTLAADTKKGLRPSFSSAAVPTEAECLYDYFVAEAKRLSGGVQAGVFAADMKVELLNDGPVTFLLEV